MGMTTAAYNQDAFRFRSDAGVADTPATWLENEDTNHTHATGSTLRIRFQLQETAGGTANNQNWQLEYNRLSGGWNNVDATSSYVQTADGTRLDQANTGSDLLTDSGGTHQGNKGYDDVDGIAGQITTVASAAAEIEFVIQIIDADVNDGDTIQLRANNGLTATWDSVPTLTVDKPIVLSADIGVGVAVSSTLSTRVALSAAITVGVAVSSTLATGLPVWASDLDAGSGTTVVDDSGTSPAQNGSVINSDEFEWLSPDGIRLTMPSDGTGGRVEVNDVAKLDASGGVTLSIWMRPTIRDQFTMNGRTIDANVGWLTKDDAYTFEGRGHRPTLRINNVVISPVTACDLAPPLGVKTHWVVTWDDTSDTFYFYRDGVQVGTGTHAQTGITNTTKKLVIGGVDGVSQAIGEFFDPKVYDYELSSTAVAALATSAPDPLVRAPVCIWSYSGSSFTGTDSFSPEGDSLTYYWDFGDGTTSTSSAPTKSHSAGEYRVVLRVTDASGNTDHAGQWVRVTDPDGGGTSVTVTGGVTIDGNSAYTNPSTTWIVANAPTGGNVFDAWTGDTGSLDDASEPFAAVTVAGTALSFTATYKTDPRSGNTLHLFRGRYNEDYSNHANWWFTGGDHAIPTSNDDVDVGDDTYDAIRCVVDSASVGDSIQLAEGRTAAGSRVILDANLTCDTTYEVGKDEEGVTVHRTGTLSCTDLIVGGRWNNSKGLYYNRGGTVSCTNLYIGRDPGVGDDHESNCALIQTSGSLTASTATVVDTTYTFLLGELALRGGTASLAALEVDEGILEVDGAMTSVAASTITIQAGATIEVTGASVQEITATGNVTLASGSTIDLSGCTASGGTYALISVDDPQTITDSGAVVVGTDWTHDVVDVGAGWELQVTKAGGLEADITVGIAAATDLTLRTALSAASDVGVAVASVLSTRVPLTAAIDVGVAATTVLTGRAALVGTIDVGVAVDATSLELSAPLTGTIDVGVAATTVLTGRAALVGTIDVGVSAVAGDLELSAPLTGTIDVGVSVAADLTTRTALTAAVDVGIAAATVLTTRVALPATIDVGIAVDATLSATGSGALSADIGVGVATSTLLSTRVALPATIDVGVAVAADLTGRVPLAAATDVGISAAADLTTRTALTAAADVGLAVSSLLSTRVALVAVIDVGVAVDSTLSASGAGVLSADIDVGVAASTLLTSRVALPATIDVGVAVASVLSTRVPLVAAIDVGVAADATLSKIEPVELSANITVAVGVEGVLSAGRFSANISVGVQASSVLTGRAALSAASSISVGASSTLYVPGLEGAFEMGQFFGNFRHWYPTDDVQSQEGFNVFLHAADGTPVTGKSPTGATSGSQTVNIRVLDPTGFPYYKSISPIPANTWTELGFGWYRVSLWGKNHSPGNPTDRDLRFVGTYNIAVYETGTPTFMPVPGTYKVTAAMQVRAAPYYVPGPSNSYTFKLGISVYHWEDPEIIDIQNDADLTALNMTIKDVAGATWWSATKADLSFVDEVGFVEKAPASGLTGGQVMSLEVDGVYKSLTFTHKQPLPVVHPA